MASKKSSMSNNKASKSSQENGRVGGGMTKSAVERAKKSTNTEALKQEVASELGIQPGKNATAAENGRVGGEMTKKLYEKGKNSK
ncbi:MAG: alpha/beta-type small acid-soluble spore protein [Anaeroplasmataceae bacterium]|nr:alpha/beta-type small acid-soluble spore protein [Anaeroplasmataceae bacterium]